VVVALIAASFIQLNDRNGGLFWFFVEEPRGYAKKGGESEKRTTKYRPLISIVFPEPIER
jgi:hypothetical protein